LVFERERHHLFYGGVLYLNGDFGRLLQHVGVKEESVTGLLLDGIEHIFQTYFPAGKCYRLLSQSVRTCVQTGNQDYDSGQLHNAQEFGPKTPIPLMGTQRP